MKKLIIATALLLSFGLVNAQNIGIGTNNPEASAALDVTATNKGFLPPRISEAQRTGITTPAAGLLVYQTDQVTGYYYYNGTQWAQLRVESQLEKITETGKTGYRILGRNPAIYGDIGSEAIDLSYSDGSFNERGAINDFAVAMGYGTTASGPASTAMGNLSIASGDYSTAMGHLNIASGTSSMAIGHNTLAKSFAEVAVGSYNTNYTPASTNVHQPSDRAFGVGIGNGISISPNYYKDGLIVYKNGNTFISNNGGTPANGGTSILPPLLPAALQIRAQSDGINLLTGTNNNGFAIAKASIPDMGSPSYISFGYMNANNYTAAGSISPTNSGTGVGIFSASDSRLKIDKGMFENGLTTINKIKIHNYNWKQNNIADVGVFAQELYKVFPNAVTKGDDTESTLSGEVSKIWQVDYSKLVPLMIAAIQDQQKLIEHQIKEIKELQQLRAEVDQLKELTLKNNKTPITKL